MVSPVFSFEVDACIGWICKIAASEAEKELDSLLSEEQYEDFLAAQHVDEAH